MTSHMSKFTLLCQAARLLGQVLHHVSNASALGDDSWVQLDRTLQSMLTAALNVELPDYDQITFIYRYVPSVPRTFSSLSNHLNSAPLLLYTCRGLPLIEQVYPTQTVLNEHDLSYNKSPTL
jgi:hypothetical protein